MKLTADQLDIYATGIFGSEIRDGAWHPHRLPAAMFRIYPSDGALIRRECPASVRLRFVTDSPKLAVTLRFGLHARPIYKLQAFTGRLIIPFGPEQHEAQWSGEVFNFGKRHREMQLIDIFMPSTAVTDVVEIDLADGSRIEPASPLPRRWLVYGDSITQGMVTYLPAFNHVNLLSLALQAEASNLAIGGAILDPALAETVPDGDFDIVSIAYGTNDQSRGIPPETYADRAGALIAALRDKHPEAPIVLCGMPPRLKGNPNTAGVPSRAYREVLVPLGASFPNVHVVTGEGLCPAEEQYLPDGVHPNEKGFECFANSLLPVFAEALELDLISE